MSEPARSGRETRLLALVIVIAIAALMLLAQFRFPGVPERPVVVPPPNALDRLAAQGSYNDLGSFISALAERLAPSFVVIDTVIAPPAPSGNGRRGRSGSSPVAIGQTLPTRLASVRVSSDRALVYLPANTRVMAVAGVEESKPDVVADAGRELALVRVSTSPEAGSLFHASPGLVAPFGYVLVIEGARGGPSTRPAFIGRLDDVEDPAWAAPIAVIGGASDVTPGALLLSLGGKFAGIVVRSPHGLAIVPPRALKPIVAALQAPKSAALPRRSLGGGGSRF